MRSLCTLVALLLIGVTPAAAVPDRDEAAAAPRQVTTAHVRPSDKRSRDLLNSGRRESEIVRRLADRIEHSDVIVYVEILPGMDHRLAGSLTIVTATEPFRYLRISLNRSLSTGQMIAALAHELQHAVEVADAPSVVDPRSLSALYRRIGIPSDGRNRDFETEAARRVGEQVRRELGGHGASQLEHE